MPAANPFTTRVDGVGDVPRNAVMSAAAVEGHKRDKAKGRREKRRIEDRICQG
jgi:hypothetical protein